MTAGPVYPGGKRTETAWIDGVQFTGEQLGMLAAICPEPGFIEGLLQIANRVHAEMLLKIEVTKAEEIATLKDVIKTASKLLGQLEKMPGRVDAILYKAQDQIKETKRALAVITAVGKDEIRKIEAKPKSKGGRPRNDNGRIIASLARKHFEAFGLDTSGTTWPETGIWPLLDALEIIYSAAGDPREKTAIAESLKTP